MDDSRPKNTVELSITVLGRTLEHLGVQMYKRREPALAELVSNAWDAGATRVDIFIPAPEEYHPETSPIIIMDNGIGMQPKHIQEEYLVVGRNRRQAGGNSGPKNRPVMGKKGIGKLAGFGLATQITVLTWRDGSATEFALDIENLKREDGRAGQVPISGSILPVPHWSKSASGTRLQLRNLKHKSPLDLNKLREALARRFSTTIRGEMRLFLNGEEVGEPTLDIEERFPAEGHYTETLPDSSVVRYYYAFTRETIKSAELRGFTVYVRGKTAQAPPFFFNVEATASGQHATKYITGAIEADFLDADSSESSDVISTDRQEIDWESEAAKPLHKWGDALARKVLRECTERKGEKLRDWILQNPEISTRVSDLDDTSKKQVRKFLLILGEAEPEQARALELADSLVRAFEYRHFHDVIGQIENVADDPEEFTKLLDHLKEWKALEGRAVLEIIKGRLDIIQKLHTMIINNLPETKSSKVADNMHDLIGGSPWILNPEWQVLAEEKKISTQLSEWGNEEIQEQDHRMRYDFLALSGEGKLVIVEIKRSGYAVTLDDLQRLERYKERLTKAHNEDIRMVMICGGNLAISDAVKKIWNERSDGEIRTWNQIYDRVRLFYEHYRAVLEGNTQDADFAKKETEVARAKHVLQTGTVHRNPQARKEGLGPQDSSYQIGILAFGSLISNPGKEILAATDKRIEGINTPFKVEFARSSRSRDGAPTLIPVNAGGGFVNSTIFLLKPTIAVDAARDMLWRRETDQAGSAVGYPGDNATQVPIRVTSFAGFRAVLYADPLPNIEPLTATHLAELAIQSARKEAAQAARDGISYLIDAKENQLKTPLSDEYEAEVLRLTGEDNLQDALVAIQACQVVSSTDEPALPVVEESLK